MFRETCAALKLIEPIGVFSVESIPWFEVKFKLLQISTSPKTKMKQVQL